MAVTRQNSNLMQALVDNEHIPSWRVSPNGMVVIWDFEQTAEAGDAGSVVRLYQTQQGPGALVMAITYLQFQGLAPFTVFTLGHESQREVGGAVVPENLTAYNPLINSFSIGSLFGQNYGGNFILVPANRVITLQVLSPVPLGSRIEGMFLFSQA